MKNKISSIKIKKGTQSEKDVDDFKDWILTKANQLGFSVEIKDYNLVVYDVGQVYDPTQCDNCDD